MESSSFQLPSSEEDLEARIHLAFPRAIGMDEFEKLFEYVTDQIRGELRYVFEGYGNIGNMFPAEKEQPRRKESYMSKLTGTITAHISFPRSLQFSAMHDNNYRDFARINGLSFEFIGQDFDEIPKEELAFMEDVKRYIQNYFRYTED